MVTIFPLPCGGVKGLPFHLCGSSVREVGGPAACLGVEMQFISPIRCCVNGISAPPCVCYGCCRGEAGLMEFYASFWRCVFLPVGSFGGLFPWREANTLGARSVIFLTAVVFSSASNLYHGSRRPLGMW